MLPGDVVFSKPLGMKLGIVLNRVCILVSAVGIGLVIGLMLTVTAAMAEHFQTRSPRYDVGWSKPSLVRPASQIALVAIPVAINRPDAGDPHDPRGECRYLEYLAHDFTGAMLHLATGSYWSEALWFMPPTNWDWFAKDTKATIFGPEGIAIPHVHPRTRPARRPRLRHYRKIPASIVFTLARMMLKTLRPFGEP